MEEVDASGLTRDQRRALRFLSVGWYGADVLIAVMALGMLVRGTDTVAAIVLFGYVVIAMPLGYFLIRSRRKQLSAANLVQIPERDRRQL